MKNFKKILVCMMAVATLGSISFIPTEVNAYLIKDADTTKGEPFTGYEEYLKECDEISIKEAIFIVDDGDYSDTYYFKSYNGIHKISELSQEDLSEYDISNVKNIINVNITSNCEFFVDTGFGYTHMFYSYADHCWGEDLSVILKQNDTTIGESENKPITEFTVGDSTFPRGDINLDGKVNTVDLLMLKKYLLGLMEW